MTSDRADRDTLDAYDNAAATFAAEWEEGQPPPTDLHAVIRQFFAVGPTADIGCGSGRDTAWLVEHGYAACGFDASEGLLVEARRRHPGVRFARAALPELVGVAAGGFANVLCETVIMHLSPDAIGPAIARLLDLLAPDGTLYLSWRVTPQADRRDEHGRLYAAFDPGIVLAALASTRILLDEQRGSASSGKLVRRIVARKRGRASE
jgi:SAM-dependent methyltransferase